MEKKKKSHRKVPNRKRFIPQIFAESKEFFEKEENNPDCKKKKKKSSRRAKVLLLLQYGKKGVPPDMSDEDLIKMGEKMIEWCEENKDNPKIVHKVQWYSTIGLTTPEWVNLSTRTVFRRYYEYLNDFFTAKTLYNRAMPESYGNRYITYYDRELDDHEREKQQRKIDYEIKKKQADEAAKRPGNEIQLDELFGLVGQMRKLMEQNDALKAQIEEKDKKKEPDGSV